MTSPNSFEPLLSKLGAIAASSDGDDARLAAVCDLLATEVDHYDWVGFYVSDTSGCWLKLGPYNGDPTDHVWIPYGRGICGQAAERAATFVVDDVNAESNYLACSLAVKSEIVIPLFQDGKVVGELDIDSHTLAAFTPEDRAFLDEVAARVAPWVTPVDPPENKE